jgi:hypothetical protein
MLKLIFAIVVMFSFNNALAVKKISDTYPYVNTDSTTMENGRTVHDYQTPYLPEDHVEMCNNYRELATLAMMIRQGISPEKEPPNIHLKKNVEKLIKSELEQTKNIYGKNSVNLNIHKHMTNIIYVAYEEYPYMENNSNREKMVVAEAFGEHFYKFCVHREEELRYLMILGETRAGKASPISELIVKNEEIRNRHKLAKHKGDSTFDGETTLKILGTVLNIVRWTHGMP